MEEIVLEQSKIVLKDIFRFDELLSKPEFQGKWIKARFNKIGKGMILLNDTLIPVLTLFHGF
ncbi:TPA: hypothetical protein ACGOY7_000844 [Streptococcus suis]